ncbi:MAG: hypothetical protein LQ350_001847 [Teloschistes chrysophthalmus]|nr:MAG: hypothetical protein LQ350_001847 [Niorma chrysophthalma]
MSDTGASNDHSNENPERPSGWFKEQTEEDGCHPDKAKALQAYLNNETTAQEAAHSITQTMLSSDDPNVYCNFQQLWGLIQDALTSQTPPVAINKDFEDGIFTWKGLLAFGDSWADCYTKDWWREVLSETLSSCPTFDEKLKKRQELRDTHVKRANIEARLAVANIGEIPVEDWGYEEIADALERHNAVLDFEIPAARQWIEVAGPALHTGVKEGRESWALNARGIWGKKRRR